jgi:hypothetical protein
MERQMLRKSKVIAVGLSLLLASIAGVASAGESSIYHRDLSTNNGCGAVYMGGTPGFEGNFEVIEYSVPSMANGESITVAGMTSNGVASSFGQFSCVNGTIYYSGEDYLSYDWSW